MLWVVTKFVKTPKSSSNLDVQKSNECNLRPPKWKTLNHAHHKCKTNFWSKKLWKVWDTILTIEAFNCVWVNRLSTSVLSIWNRAKQVIKGIEGQLSFETPELIFSLWLCQLRVTNSLRQVFGSPYKTSSLFWGALHICKFFAARLRTEGSELGLLKQTSNWKKFPKGFELL